MTIQHMRNEHLASISLHVNLDFLILVTVASISDEMVI